MTNACSTEHPFECKMRVRHNRITVFVLSFAVLIVASGCLPDPHRTETSQLLDRLTTVRGSLATFPPPTDACSAVGDIETRLYGEPGLTSVQPAWSELADAAHALQAVCGQDALLQQPANGTAALASARDRWQAGTQREMGVACDHLRAAANALGRGAPC